VEARRARNTFGGNPLCCAAALATLDLVEREYAANAASVGDYSSMPCASCSSASNASATCGARGS